MGHIKIKTHINTELGLDTGYKLTFGEIFREGGKEIGILTFTPRDATALHMAQSPNWQLQVPSLQFSVGNGHLTHFQQEVEAIGKIFVLQ